MGSVGREENMAIFKLQEIEKKESAVLVVSPDRLQLAEKESGFLERVVEVKAVIFYGREEVKAAEGCGEGECGGGECRSSSTCREGKWVSREGCRGEGFFAEEKKIRQPSGVEKKRRQKEEKEEDREEVWTLVGADEKEEKEEDKNVQKIRFSEG
ncbi:hypothetical protein OIU78_014473 [Salix suchowensis]|nr:hypothetical protein OIU78_014473 [Salix suchowensis]